MGFRKKNAAKAAPASEPVTAQNAEATTPAPIVEISDSERLAHVVRTMPITMDAIDKQLLADLSWVRRKRLHELLAVHRSAAMNIYTYQRLAETEEQIVALFDEVAAGK